MYVGDNKFEAPSKIHKPEVHNEINTIPEKVKRMPRRSEANFTEMKASNL